MKKRRGMTLTEVSIVMMIMGFVLAGIWIAVEAVYMRSRVTTTSKQLIEIVSRIRSIYGLSRGQMMDMTIAGQPGATLMAQIGVIPDDMFDKTLATPIVTHIWGGEVHVDAVTTSVTGDSFTLSLLDVPSAPCADLVLRMTGNNRDPGMLVAGTSSASQATAAMPIGITTATSDCSASANTVIFTFLLK